MKRRPLGTTGIDIAPLVFGGNVFGWTADQSTSFKLLDRFEEAGFNAIDTADVYSSWIPGNEGGESETIIGNWLKQKPDRRENTVIITKVGSEFPPGQKGLSEKHIMKAVEGSLKRLQTDFIDVYLSHWPDNETAFEETLGAYDQLIRQGKVRTIGSSNLSAAQLSEALTTSKAHNLPRYGVEQPHYNLFERNKFEGDLSHLCIREEIGVITYSSLASGFLTGKYRSENDLNKSPRGQGMTKFLTERGFRILKALDSVAAANNAEPAEIALAWLIARPGVTAPIASATSLKQLESLIRSTQISISPEHLDQLTHASEYTYPSGDKSISF